MKDNDRLNRGLKEFEESDTMEQSLALVDIVKDLLVTTRYQLRKTYILLILSLVFNVAIVCAFLLYELQFTYQDEEIVEKTVTQTVDGRNSEINNVKGSLYKDNATHNDSRRNKPN